MRRASEGKFVLVLHYLFVRELPSLYVFPLEQHLLWDLARPQELPICRDGAAAAAAAVD